MMLIPNPATNRPVGKVDPATGVTKRIAMLENRKICVLVSIYCAISTVWSWALSVRRSRHPLDLFSLETLVFTIWVFILTSIAYRSAFWTDRVVSAALAGVLALAVARTLVFTPSAMFAIDVAHSLMWTIASVVCLIVLAGGFKASRD
jgi:hypothetical protein